jgi:hypothetical protein
MNKFSLKNTLPELFSLTPCVSIREDKMKEQDAIVDLDGHKMVLFVEKEDGKYGTVATGSYMVKNYVDDFWDKKQKIEKSLFDEVTSGRKSPIYYYMHLREMNEADVAVRARVSVGLVRKHIIPKQFESMTIKIATRYAEVFGIPLANLFQIIPMHPANKAIIQTPTAQSAVIVTTLMKDPL